MSVASVDYGSGNLHSAAKAFERAARESGHDQPILVTSKPDDIARMLEPYAEAGVEEFTLSFHPLDDMDGMHRGIDLFANKVMAKLG